MTYEAVVARVAEAASRVGRSAADIQIVVVSKGRSVEAIRDVYDRGQRVFAENRAQDLVAKTPQLPADITWHFVGPLQSNKVRLVRPVATLLHSYDRDDLGKAWLKGPGVAPPVLIQVNVGAEPQKHGFATGETEQACERALALGVQVTGLMTIPPMCDDPEDVRPYFAAMRRLRDRMAARWPQVAELSMGMTDDFEVAVEEGATIIRPGRAIFGD